MDERAYLNAFGYFAKLPVEIRIIIWDFLLLEVKDHKDHTESFKNPLAILSCSSCLYGEISYHFSHNRIPLVILRSNHHFGYMTAKIPFNHLQILNRKTLKDKAALQQYLNAFIRHQGPNKKVHIEIPPLCYTHSVHPCRAVSCLKKVTDLLDVLKQWSHTSMLHVRVELVEEWVKQGKPSQCWQRNAVYPNNDDSHRVIDDHHIAILPFSILPDWEYVLPPGLEGVLSAQSNKSSPSLLEKSFHHNTTSTADIVTASTPMSIHGWLLKTRHLLDNELDNNYGWTANQLRLERFKNWFKDQSDLNEECESAYEKQFLADLESDHDVVLRQDPRLDNARRRHHYLVYVHAFINAYAVKNRCVLELDENGKHKYPLYSSWNSHVWSSTYEPYGFEPLTKRMTITSDCVEEKECPTYKNYQKAFRVIGRFSDALSWWGFEAQYVFENRSGFSDTVNCTLCSEHGSPCFWCKKYQQHAQKKCNYCREWVETPTSQVSPGSDY
ncbi:hypothetical protein N7540_002821 [Penicillium herquei]|nr:hypothetical protein N7540_002821 [Penicillium herquei]